MNFHEKVEQAFKHRPKPVNVIGISGPLTTEYVDALWFTDRDWKEITWEDWELHRDAVYAFTPEAFAYYLPSILILSSQRPTEWFWPADALLQVLDRSPTVAYWDDFLLTRFMGLRVAEYEVLSEWLVYLSEHESFAAPETLARSFDTINLLQKETEKREQ
jgi:hypothetical protein